MFHEINWLVIIIYCITLAAMTEITKRKITKKIDIHPIWVSWTIGMILFFVAHVAFRETITTKTIGMFIGGTFATFGCYKNYQVLWRFLSSKLTWLPGPDDKGGEK